MQTTEEIKQTEEKEMQVSYRDMLSVIKKFQHTGYAVAGGFLGMTVAMTLWALLTVVSHIQIGYMAIGVGLLVGWLVRIMGRGVGMRFALIGAFFALLSCLLGNLLSALILTGVENSISFQMILAFLTWEVVGDVYVATFSPMDLLFYAIAVYEGFRFACVPVEKVYAEIKEKEAMHLPVTYPWRFPLTVLSVAGMLIGLSLYVTLGNKAVYFYESGVKQAEGEIKNGAYNGQWFFWNEAGELDHTGYYENGLMTGEWVWFYAEDKVSNKENYVNGLKDGIATTYYENGRLADSVTYVRGRKEGMYYVWNEAGQLLQTGAYRKDLPVGHWMTYYDSGQVKEEGEMEAGNKTGLWKSYFEDGALRREGEFLEGEREKVLNVWDAGRKQIIVEGNGWYQGKDEGGVIREEGRIENGFPVGPWKKYDASGKLQEIGEYKGEQYFIQKAWDGLGDCVVEKGNGEYKSYYEDGTLCQEGTVRDGLFHCKMRLYYPSGNLYTENDIYEGKPHGWQKVYYETGEVQVEGKLKAGKRDSVWCWYYPMGSVESKVNFRNGKKEGVQEFFDEEGRLLKEEKYENGEEVR